MPENNEAREVDTEVVCCDGGGGTLGHPAVYLNLLPAGEIQCPYCSRMYRLANQEKAS